MSVQLKKGIVAGLCVIGLIYFYHRWTICDCKDRISYKDVDLNQSIDLDRLFAPMTVADSQKIMDDWANFELKSDSFQIVNEYYFTVDRAVKIVEHYAEGKKHYGAVFLPYQYDANRQYPLLLWANGLNQADPSMHIDKSFLLRKYLMELQDYFIVVPAFRGQALAIGEKRYCSDGFFGDAFDGATDDALRLMALAIEQYPAIDTGRLVVNGVSRGGTVALLAGIRYPQFKGVIAQAGPVDFFSKEVFSRYHLQYKYQFLSKTTNLSAIREKIIKSSPIHFITHYSNRLVIVHGESDEVVPLENATQLLAQLEDRGNVEYVVLPTGHRIDYTKGVIDWLRKNNI